MLFDENSWHDEERPMSLQDLAAPAVAKPLARADAVPNLCPQPPLVVPAPARAPFRFQKLDHIVLRCASQQKMLDFYVGVLGAEPHTLPDGVTSSVGRFGGCLTHLRIGSSLIDLQSYHGPMGRKLHAGGAGLSPNAPLPKLDGENGPLDHFAITLEPYEPDVVRAYLASKGAPPFAEGARYGADGEGWSMYLRDPELNVVELKCGAAPADSMIV